jgi:hypothetical protein
MTKIVTLVESIAEAFQFRGGILRLTAAPQLTLDVPASIGDRGGCGAAGSASSPSVFV